MSSTGSEVTGDAAAVAAAAAAAAAAAKPWYDGLPPEDVGYITNRGLDKLDAKAAFVNAMKAHQEAEKGIGIPTDRRLIMPKDTNDVDNWKNLNAKLGVPADAKDYDFANIKFTNGDPVEDKFLAAIRPVLQQAHVSKDAAPAVVKAVVSYLEQAETGDVAEKAAALATEKTALSINWGPNVQANLVIAQNTAAKLGIDPAAVNALENQVGYAKVMEMFRKVGTMIGEDTFVKTGSPGNQQLMTAEGAEAALAEKQNDTDFVKRLNAGDATALREFNNITQMVAAGRAARR